MYALIIACAALLGFAVERRRRKHAEAHARRRQDAAIAAQIDAFLTRRDHQQAVADALAAGQEWARSQARAAYMLGYAEALADMNEARREAGE